MGTALVVPQLARGRLFGADAPSNRIAVGFIGTGDHGTAWNLRRYLTLPEAKVVAVCDVDGARMRHAKEIVDEQYRNQDCGMTKDFREVLARKDIDAVMISTPDHWHTLISVMALRAGKDVQCEKPTLSIDEGKVLIETVRKHGRVFQTSTEDRSIPVYHRMAELVRNGRIGKLKNIDVWASASRPGGSTSPIAPPDDLDYDFWLGPAPQTPYTLGKAYDEGDAWKTWWYNYDYALGFVAGWGVHPLDIAYWGHPGMMNGPVEIEGPGMFPLQGACTTSIAWNLAFKFADGVTMHYRGTRNNCEPVAMNDFQDWTKKYGPLVDHGTAFEGSDGWVLVDRTQIRTSPERLVEEKPGDRDVQLIKSGNHVRNLLDSMKSRQPAICPIEDSVQADILCHLSDITTRVKHKVTWDPKAEQFVDDPEANGRLKLRVQREKWALKS